MTLSDKIIEAAAVVFAARGFTAATTKQIAKRARVAEPSLFRLFKSKAQLFEEVIRVKLVPTIKEACDYIDNLHGTDIPEHIARIAKTYYGDPVIMRLRFWAGLESGPARKMLQHHLTEWVGCLRKYVQRNPGLFREGIPPEALAVLMAAPFAYHYSLVNLFNGEEILHHRTTEALECYEEAILIGILSPKMLKSRALDNHSHEVAS